MEGHAKIETFDYIGDDPASAPLLKQMRGADGKPTVCDNVWISYFTGSGEANGEGFGKLTTGYGSRAKPDKDGGKIGPEFTFGLAMDAALDEPVLIIKTAWGGKSLHTDFRPPSAGPYVPTAEELKRWAGKPEKEKEVAAATGVYYRLMVEHAFHMLDHEPIIDAGFLHLVGLPLFKILRDAVACLLRVVLFLPVAQFVRPSARRAEIRVQAASAPCGFDDEHWLVERGVHREPEGELWADLSAVLVGLRA